MFRVLPEARPGPLCVWEHSHNWHAVQWRTQGWWWIWPLETVAARWFFVNSPEKVTHLFSDLEEVKQSNWRHWKKIVSIRGLPFCGTSSLQAFTRIAGEDCWFEWWSDQCHSDGRRAITLSVETHYFRVLQCNFSWIKPLNNSSLLCQWIFIIFFISCSL